MVCPSRDAEAKVGFVEPAANDEFSARSDAGSGFSQKVFASVVVHELEDVEDSDISLMFGETIPRVDVGELDLGVTTLGRHRLAVANFSGIKVETLDGGEISVFSKKEGEQAHAATDVEEGRGAVFQLAQNSGIKRVGGELGPDVVSIPRHPERGRRGGVRSFWRRRRRASERLVAKD